MCLKCICWLLLLAVVVPNKAVPDWEGYGGDDDHSSIEVLLRGMEEDCVDETVGPPLGSGADVVVEVGLEISVGGRPVERAIEDGFRGCDIDVESGKSVMVVGCAVKHATIVASSFISVTHLEHTATVAS